MKFWVAFIFLTSTIHSTFCQSLNDNFLSALNEIRQSGCQCARPAGPLKFHPLLASSALAFATDMVNYDYFDHADRQGRDVAGRIDEIGYRWMSVGENLGINQKTVAEIIQDWLDSPSHCRMMMDPTFTEAGIARYKNVWVLHLGKPEF